ncbi:MAG: HIT domain-containing protein [Candidatus Pacearchaeota archaeon]
MSLNQEQAKAIKEQLIQNIDKSFPEDKKEFAKSQINSMDSGQLEEFLKKNNLKIEGNNLTSTNEGTSQCIFCSIISEDVDSYKIAENNDSAAFLEINPLSEGHSIVIPKDHISSVEDMPPTAFLLSKKITKKIKETLKPKKVEVSSSNMFGHEIINVIPVYGNEIPSEKQQAKPERLKELQKILWTDEKEDVEEKTGPRIINLDSEKIWLPKRIP